MKRIVLLLTLAALLPVSAVAQPANPPNVNMADFIRETQKQAAGSGDMSFVWWIPAEFWQVSLAANPSITAEQAKEVVAVFRPYLVLVVVEGKMGSFGAVTFKSEQAVRSEVKVIDAKGQSYTPIADEQVSAEAKLFVRMMRPVIGNMLGSMGENMHFVFFRATDGSGAEIANPTGENDFEVQLGEERFHWRLPLGSLLPPKVCPEDGESLNGAWSYCPWHGTKLKPQVPSADAGRKEGQEPRKEEARPPRLR